METPVSQKKRRLFTVVAGLVVITVLILLSFNFFLRKKPSILESSPKEIPQELAVSSFGDLFSGNGYINNAETSMYQDAMVTAFTFPPKFELAELDEKPEAEFLEPLENQKICLKPDCLSLIGQIVHFNDRSLASPPEISGKKLSHVSIGALTKKWLIAYTVKDNNLFKSWLFTFNGSEFKKIVDGEDGLLQSKYDGAFGFGGDDDHWLALYGAYEGRGVEYISNSMGNSVKDISVFFNAKLMKGGFLPGIIKNPKENWYVVSRSAENPKLIKLFENGGGSIVGALDLTGKILPQETKNNVFFSKGSKPSVLFMKIVADERFYEIKDFGFEAEGVWIITSSDTYNVPAHPAEIRLAKITNINLEAGKGKAIFYLSNDGKEWFEAKVGELIEFPNKDGRVLLWKAKFSPSGDNQNSPFFDKINISLWRKML